MRNAYFHSSSVDASPTVKLRLTGLSVHGSDNKSTVTRFLFLLVGWHSSGTSGNSRNFVDHEKIIFSFSWNLRNALVLNLRSFSMNSCHAFCAGKPRTKRDRKTNSCALLYASTNQKSFLENNAFGNGCGCIFINSIIAFPMRLYSSLPSSLSASANYMHVWQLAYDHIYVSQCIIYVAFVHAYLPTWRKYLSPFSFVSTQCLRSVAIS